MGRLSASIIVISAILIMATFNLQTFGATYTYATLSSSSLYLTPPYDNTTMSFDSAACNCTLLNASDEEVFTHSVSCLYPISSTYIYTVTVSPYSCYKTIIQRITNTINSGTVACSTIPSTATITQSITISESGAVACSTKQATTAAGIVGGFVGGSVFGIVVAVLVTAMAAILITKHHRKGEISTQSRYITIVLVWSLSMCVAQSQG
jgi:hypothetical protein